MRGSLIWSDPGYHENRRTKLCLSPDFGYAEESQDGRKPVRFLEKFPNEARALERVSMDQSGPWHGEACIKGTRNPVRMIIGSLADGMTTEGVVEAYPRLAKDDIQAALACVADLLHQEILLPLL